MADKGDVPDEEIDVENTTVAEDSCLDSDGGGTPRKEKGDGGKPEPELLSDVAGRFKTPEETQREIDRLTKALLDQQEQLRASEGSKAVVKSVPVQGTDQSEAMDITEQPETAPVKKPVSVVTETTGPKSPPTEVAKEAVGSEELPTEEAKVDDRNASMDDSTADVDSNAGTGWSEAESRKSRKKRAKRAQRADTLAKAGRSSTTAKDLMDDKGRYWVPPKHDPDTGLSDDEDWFDDDSHPIEWYRRELLNLISDESLTLGQEIKMKVTYAWNFYAPGDPCPYIRCVDRTGQRAALTFPTMDRYARHILETHLPRRMALYCVPGDNPRVKNACHGWTDGELHRSYRRGELVRHLMKNGSGHNSGLLKAVRIAKAVWDSTEGEVTVGKMQKRMVNNTLTRRFRLTEHDWARCVLRTPGMGDQRDTGDIGNDTGPRPKPIPASATAKRGRSTTRSGDKDRASSKPAKKPKSEVTKPAEKSAGSQAAVSTVDTVVVGKTKPLTKVKARQLKQMVALATETLGVDSGEQMKIAFLKSHSVLESVKVQPNASTKAAAKFPAASQTSSSTYADALAKDSSLPRTSTPEGLDIQNIEDDSGQRAPTEAVMSPAVSATGGSEVSSVPSDNAQCLVPVPDASPQILEFINPVVVDLRDHLAISMSRVFESQISEYEKAIVRTGSILAREAQGEVDRLLKLERETYAAKEQSLVMDSLYHQRRYNELLKRVEKIDAAVFRQSGVSLQAWEGSGFATLPRLGTSQAGGSSGVVSVLTSQMGAMASSSPGPNLGDAGRR